MLRVSVLRIQILIVVPVIEVLQHSIMRILTVLAVISADTASTRNMSAVSTSHTASARSMSAVSTAILSVLAVRNIPSVLEASVQYPEKSVEKNPRKHAWKVWR